MSDPGLILSSRVLLPELELEKFFYRSQVSWAWVRKTSRSEVCPRCASLSTRIYDHRKVRVKDEPMRGRVSWLVIKKRRFWCPKGHVFSEPVQGILPRRRTTQRYRQAVLVACEDFVSLKKVRQKFRCSSSFLYGALYEQLELRQRTRQYPWPEVIGIDEHAFGRAKKYGGSIFNTMLVDIKNHRLMELVEGKAGWKLNQDLGHIAGPGNVRWVVMDMCETYRSFVKNFFPNSEVIADKFHILRLFSPALKRARMNVTGDNRSNPIRILMQRNGRNLELHERSALLKWMNDQPSVSEVYHYKELMHRFYRCPDYRRAEVAFEHIRKGLLESQNPELRRIGRSYTRWREPILNYFRSRRTNAMTEGFNNKAKLVKRMAYGYKSFRNFRLRLLNACA